MSNLVNQSLSNFTFEELKFNGSTEGMLFAYISLFMMAVVSIYWGSLRSLEYQQKSRKFRQTQHNKTGSSNCGTRQFAMSHKEAALIPVITSVVLLFFYCVIKGLFTDFLTLMLDGYFVFMNNLTLGNFLIPYVCMIFKDEQVTEYIFSFSIRTGNHRRSEFLTVTINYQNLITLILSTTFGILHWYNKWWITNNLYGLVYAMDGVVLLQIGSVTVGCTLLAGLLIYDIYWVFFSDVMMTVAMSLEVPLKLMFPRDCFHSMPGPRMFAMLGLGDVVVPGVFMALLLQFDKSLNRSSNFYFHSSFVSYIIGLTATGFAIFYYKKPQPALLYLVPMVVGCSILLAALKGDLRALFSFKPYEHDNDDNIEEEQEQEEIIHHNIEEVQEQEEIIHHNIEEEQEQEEIIHHNIEGVQDQEEIIHQSDNDFGNKKDN